MKDYKQILKEVNNTITSNNIFSKQDFEKMSDYLFTMKQPLVFSEPNSIEYYVYFAIQNTSLYLDKCRNKNINWNVSYQKLGKKITKYWTKEYKKFSLA